MDTNSEAENNPEETGSASYPDSGPYRRVFVKQYPDVFPGFYYYDTGDFQEKYETVRQLNLSNRGSHSVFLDGLIVSKWS
jgi:hypothetical protein